MLLGIWLALIGWTAPAHAEACPLYSVFTELDTHRLTVPFSGAPSGARHLSRESVVRGTVGGACPDGETRVQVVATNWWYDRPGRVLALAGDTGCVAATSLRDLRGQMLRGVHPPPSWPPPGIRPGQIIGPLDVPLDCDQDAVSVAGERVPVSLLRNTRPVGPGALANLDTVRAAYRTLFADSPDVVLDQGATDVSAWGRVALPLVRFRTEAELRDVRRDEGMKLASQQSKVITAEGPRTPGGVPVWLHFRGADPRYSDLWGQPDVIVGLMTLFRTWVDHCTARLAPDRPEACTVQVGDIGLASPLRPDPLGHRDHYEGRCVDLRLFRSDGSRYEAMWNQDDDRPGLGRPYSQPLTRQFLAFAVRSADVGDVYFGDPVVAAAVEGVEVRKGHDDHMHLCLADP